MRILLTGAVALLLASPAHAQLAPPNAQGVTFGHVHLNVGDIEVHKKLWVEQFDGVLVEKGPLTVVKFPGQLVALTGRAPTGGSQGTSMDHFGFKVRNMAEALASWRAAGMAVVREFTGAEGGPNAYVEVPDGVRFELQEDRSLRVKAEAYHVHFYAQDEEALRNWYVDIFGAVPATRGTIQTTANVPGQNLSFAHSDEALAPTLGRAIDHIGFEIDDLKAFTERLEARGITMDTPYREIASIELAIAYFTDPVGVRIELTQGYDEY